MAEKFKKNSDENSKSEALQFEHQAQTTSEKRKCECNTDSINNMYIHKFILNKNGFFHYSCQPVSSDDKIEAIVRDYEDRFKKYDDWESCFLVYGKAVMEKYSRND